MLFCLRVGNDYFMLQYEESTLFEKSIPFSTNKKSLIYCIRKNIYKIDFKFNKVR